MAMEPKFIKDWIFTSLVFGACGQLVLFFLDQPHFGFGLGITVLWGCLNLIALQYLLGAYLTLSYRNFPIFALLSTLKFPVLYGSGYLLLTTTFIPRMSVLLGFSIVFVALSVCGLTTMARNQWSSTQPLPQS